MTALITVNAAAAETVKGAPARATLAELAESDALNGEMKRIVKRVNGQLAPFEQIRKFKILDREFSIESGEITPTMKLRRGKVLENCKGEISGLYVGRDDV